MSVSLSLSKMIILSLHGNYSVHDNLCSNSCLASSCVLTPAVVVCTCLDEMEFEVGTDTRTSKLIARRVVRLPTGTVSFESISEDRLLGKVDCEPKIVTGASPSDNPRRGSRVSLIACNSVKWDIAYLTSTSKIHK